VYNKCNKKLSKSNNWLVFIRGNHDNPAYFNLQPVQHRRWMTLPDYSVVKACGHTILCIGGATSIDRQWRMSIREYHLPNLDEPLAPNVYWRDESPFFDEERLEMIDETCSIDAVVTHTSPSFCELSSHQGLQDWAMRDENLMDDVKYERKMMDAIYTHLRTRDHPLRHWYYGHFHQSWHAEIDGVLFNMLDIMELRELR
jgi:UDP-2,3-diacylglucosamine pyrophosphatase LpxH